MLRMCTEKFAELTKEELIQHLVSYEFGKLLKKYKNTADLNISEDDRGGRSERGERGDQGRYDVTVGDVEKRLCTARLC